MGFNTSSSEGTQRVPERSTTAIIASSSTVHDLQCSISTSPTAENLCVPRKELCKTGANHTAACQCVSDPQQGWLAPSSARVARNDPITSVLPLEISVYVFEMYLRINMKGSPHLGLPLETPPAMILRLGAVSRNWRAIAWSSPSLWTTLSVNLRSAGHADGPQLVYEWIKRTVSRPITVRVHRGPINSPVESLTNLEAVHAQHIMLVLNLSTSKLISLDIRDIPLSITSLLESSREKSMLRDLRIGNADDMNLITSSPNNKLRLFGRDVVNQHSPSYLLLQWSIPLNLLNIKWSNITKMGLDHVSRKTVFDAIALSPPSLKSLTLSAIKDHITHVDDYIPSRLYRLPELEILSYTEFGASEGTSGILFSSLLLPSLSILDYRGYEWKNVMPIEEMRRCIQSSACTILDLTVHEPSLFNAANLLSLLHETPALESLDIIFDSMIGPPHSIEPILQQLQHTIGAHGEDIFLPCLQYLGLDVHPLFEWPSLARIWLINGSANPQDQSFDFQNINIHPERTKLGADIIVRYVDDTIFYLPPQVVSAFIAILPELDENISFSQWSTRGYDKVDTISRDVPALLENSFFHSFPINGNEANLSLYNKAKVAGIFQAAE